MYFIICDYRHLPAVVERNKTHHRILYFLYVWSMECIKRLRGDVTESRVFLFENAQNLVTKLFVQWVLCSGVQSRIMKHFCMTEPGASRDF